MEWTSEMLIPVYFSANGVVGNTAPIQDFIGAVLVNLALMTVVLFLLAVALEKLSQGVASLARWMAKEAKYLKVMRDIERSAAFLEQLILNIGRVSPFSRYLMKTLESRTTVLAPSPEALPWKRLRQALGRLFRWGRFLCLAFLRVLCYLVKWQSLAVIFFTFWVIWPEIFRDIGEKLLWFWVSIWTEPIGVPGVVATAAAFVALVFSSVRLFAPDRILLRISARQQRSQKAVESLMSISDLFDEFVHEVGENLEYFSDQFIIDLRLEREQLLQNIGVKTDSANLVVERVSSTVPPDVAAAWSTLSEAIGASDLVSSRYELSQVLSFPAYVGLWQILSQREAIHESGSTPGSIGFSREQAIEMWQESCQTEMRYRNELQRLTDAGFEINNLEWVDVQMSKLESRFFWILWKNVRIYRELGDLRDWIVRSQRTTRWDQIIRLGN